MAVSFSQSASCGGDSGMAGFAGALSGLANIIGLGGLVSAIPGLHDSQDAQKALQAAQANLSQVTDQWKSIIEDEKLKGLEDEENLLQTMIQANQNQQGAIDEVLNEKIQTNSLMIAMLTILVVFLIIYDLV